MTFSLRTYIELFVASLIINCMIVGGLQYFYYFYTPIPREVIFGIAASSAFAMVGILFVCSLIADYFDRRMLKKSKTILWTNGAS